MAVLDEKGENYILNGSKIFITNAYYADVFIIIAMTDKSKGQRGLSAFIVERTFPGFSVGAHEKKMGIKGSSTCELIMENCIVPKENLLGKENKGFNLAMATLNGGRIGIAAQALGLAEGAIDETVKYTKERKQFGRVHLQAAEHPVPAGRSGGPHRRRQVAGLQRCHDQAGRSELCCRRRQGQAVRR